MIHIARFFMNHIVVSYAQWLHPCLSPTGPALVPRTRQTVTSLPAVVFGSVYCHCLVTRYY
jgi:hypothetical protein